MNKKELDTKWWFRLLKVFYFVLLIFVVGGGALLVIDSSPSRIITHVKVACSNGTSFYNTEKNIVIGRESISAGRFSMHKLIGELNYICENPEADTSNKALTALRILKSNKAIFPEPQYTFTVEDSYWNIGWITHMLKGIAGLILALILIVLLRSTFYYVVIGEFRIRY